MNAEHYSNARDHENALFGAAIIAPHLLDELANIVSPTDFHNADLGKAFGLLVDLNAAGHPVGDTRLLVGNLRQAGLLDALGGTVAIVEAVNGSFAHNGNFYASKVRELASLRSLERTGELLVNATQQAGADPIALREQFESRLEAIQQADTNDVSSIYEMVSDALDEIREAKRRGVTLGLTTGLSDLDESTGGFFNGDLTILAARPSIGKSAFAVDLAARVAERGKQVLFVSLEMSGKQISHRFLNRETGIPVRAMQQCNLTHSQEVELIEAKERLRQLPLKAFTTSSATIAQIRARAKVHKSIHGLDLLIVDYLGLIGGNSRLSSYERVTAISRELKQLAMHIDRPVLCLAQLNREAGKPGVLPCLEHLRDSGAIEQDADNVWFLHREDRAATDAKLIIAKQRQGCVGTIQLRFDGSRMSFNEPSTEWEP